MTPSGQDQCSGAAVVAVLTEVDALPDTQIQASVGDGDRDRVAQHGRFQVSGHIVGALVVVLVVRGVFRNGLVEVPFEVTPDGWVGVFVDCQAGGGVLDKYVQQSHPYLPKFVGKLLFDGSGDEVKPPREGGQMERVLKRLHRWSTRLASWTLAADPARVLTHERTPGPFLVFLARCYG